MQALLALSCTTAEWHADYERRFHTLCCTSAVLLLKRMMAHREKECLNLSVESGWYFIRFVCLLIDLFHAWIQHSHLLHRAYMTLPGACKVVGGRRLMHDGDKGARIIQLFLSAVESGDLSKTLDAVSKIGGYHAKNHAMRFKTVIHLLPSGVQTKLYQATQRSQTGMARAKRHKVPPD